MRPRQISPAWWTAGVCAGLVAVEAAVILVGFHQANRGVLGGDGPEYTLYAFNLVQHSAFSIATAPPYAAGVTRTPGYPAFLALLDLISLHSTLLVRIAQFALIALTAWLVYAIALRLFALRVAVIAAVLCSTYPGLLWYATLTMTEGLATACATLLTLAVVVARQRPSARNWALVGLALVAEAYIRPEYAGLLVVLAIAAAMVGAGAARWRAPLALALAFLAALAPWTARNASVTHRFIPLDAGTGVSLLASAEQYAGTLPYRNFTEATWTGFYSQVYTAAFFREYGGYGTRAQVALDQRLTSQAKAVFGRVSVAKIIGGLPRRIMDMWGVSDATATDHRFGRLARYLDYADWIGIVLLCLGGMWLRRRTLLFEWPLWGLAVYTTLIHLVFHVEARYTYPPRPMLTIYAAVALVAVIDRRARSGARASPDRAVAARV